jgi:beta-ribofuranosylaminobenzene 5'-phosphate synthase
MPASLLSREPAVPAPVPVTTGAVTVRAPGRLHLGFLDPAATLGRAFGSLGIVIDGFETVIEMAKAADTSDAVTAATPPAQAELPRARALLERLRAATSCRAPLRLHLRQVLPAHAGFGSGTQLALAIGRAFVQLNGLPPVDSATLARWGGRGLRSGIGIAGFDQGGLLLDGGPGADGAAAPLLARIALPPAWRIVVIQDTQAQGLSGLHESQAIAALPPLPQATAADICHQVLMRVLPGAACADFEAFAIGVTRMQQLLGEHFAAAQGGSTYTSARVGEVARWLAANSERGAAIGQSSWGPTGFAVMASLADAQAAVRDAQAHGLAGDGLELRVVRALDRGATLEVSSDD